MATDRQSSRPHGENRIIVGRDREQARLAGLLSSALNGMGNLALVSGEAGIGKTTLVRDLVQQARERGALVLSGGCYDLTTTPTYGPWSEAFHSYQPAGGQPPLPGWFGNSEALQAVDSQAALFEEARRVFAGIAGVQPLVIVLEDLHWSDPASLDLLRYLSHHIRKLGALIVITYRDDELTRRHPFFQHLTLIVQETDAARIELQRLDTNAARELVTPYGLSEEETERLVTYLEQRAAGNPFFITELLRALDGEGILQVDGADGRLSQLDESYLPAFVLQVIERRLTRLDGGSRQALEIAAVIGQEVPFDLWESVSGLQPAILDHAVEQALEIHVMEETADRQRLAFTHSLVRDVLYEGVIPTRRRSWHRQAGEALAATSSPYPATVAHHFQQASDERAVEWYIRAGLRARDAAWFSAAQHFETAAALLEGDQRRDRERGWLRLAAGSLLRWSGDPRAIEHVEVAERLGRATGDSELAAYACGVHGAQLCIRGDIRRGLLEMQRSVTAVDSLRDTDQLPSLFAMEGLADVRWTFAGVDEAGPEHLLETNAPSVALQRGPLTNWLSMSGRYREAVDLGEAFIADLELAFGADRRPRAVVHSGHIGVGDAYAALGRPEAARQAYELGLASSLAFSDFVMAEFSVWSTLLMAVIPYQTDQLMERSRLLADAVQYWERCRGITITTAGAGAPSELQIDLLEGRWQKARDLASAHLAGPLLNHLQKAIVTLGILDRHQGHSTQAWDRITQWLPQGPATEPGNYFFAHGIEAIALAAELALDVHDLEGAQRWIEAHGHWLEWSGAVLWQPHHHLLQARYHQLAGDFDHARCSAEAALECASNPRQPLVLIAIHRLLGQIHTLHERFPEAEAHLRQSLTLANASAAPYEQALTKLAFAELWLTVGKQEAVGPLLDQARDTCASLNARPTLESIEDLASRLVARESPTAILPAGLTPRECEVLRLIAEGHSNREIAEALFLSPRTVERHIANIYLKIDVHTKAEASDYARRRHLV